MCLGTLPDGRANSGANSKPVYYQNLILTAGQQLLAVLNPLLNLDLFLLFFLETAIP